MKPATRRALQWLWRSVACLLLCMAGADAANQAMKYEIAIAPFLPTRTALQNYEPLRLYLQARLREPVSLVTATDYKTFNQRLQQQAYPFVITAANSAALACGEYGYVPLLKPAIYTRPVLVVKKERKKLTALSQLRGATIALPDAQALISMQAPALLREAGLEPDKDVTLQYLANHAAAVNSAIYGNAAAAIVSDRALRQMMQGTRDAVRVEQVWEAGAAPGIVYLASPGAPPPRVRELVRGIQAYLKTPEGEEWVQRMGYGGLEPAGEEDVKHFEHYGKQLKKLLER